MIRRIKHTSKWYHRTVAVIFVLLLFIPLIQKVTGIIHEPENVENRKLIPFPDLKSGSVDGVHLYLKYFEFWFNDHFGLRKLFIRINSLIDYRFFHTSPKAMVVVGKDGWLYYNNIRDGKNLNDFYGYENFTKKELERITQNLDTIKARLAKRGIPVLFVLIPNKQTIYPEFLPSNMRHDHAPVTRADQIDRLFAASGIPFIDMRFLFREQRTHFPCLLYYKTDSHWNDLGAFIGYQHIMREVKKAVPQCQYYTIGDFTLKLAGDKGSGDLANLIFLGGQLADQKVMLAPKVIPKYFTTDEEYKLPTVIYGNMDKTKPRLLMFHDSFTRAMRPFIAEDFSRSVFIWDTKITFSIVDKEKPDMLIVEFAERYSGMLLKLY